MYEYTGRLRREEIALDIARRIRDYRKKVENNHYEDLKALLEDCYAFTDRSPEISMKVSRLRTDLSNTSWEKSLAIQNDYYDAEKEYWEKQKERSHRQDIIQVVVSTFLYTSSFYILVFMLFLK
jgi:hypothetical protein